MPKDAMDIFESATNASAMPSSNGSGKPIGPTLFSLVVCIVGDDILDPFAQASDQWKFLIVAISYFTNGWRQNPWQTSPRVKSRPFSRN